MKINVGILFLLFLSCDVNNYSSGTGNIPTDSKIVYGPCSKKCIDSYGGSSNYKYIYNANGTLAAIIELQNRQRLKDTAYSYSYDKNGFRTQERYYPINEITPSVKQFEPDSNGNIAVETYNNSVKKYNYSIENHKILKKMIDYHGDGTIDEIDEYKYNSNGKVSTIEYDTDYDGLCNSKGQYTYDSNGNNTIVEFDQDNDGSINWIYRYTYDSNGNMLQERYEGKTMSWTNYFSYECW